MSTMNSVLKLSTNILRRQLHTTPKALSNASKLQNFDPNNYNIPLRYPTMEDEMEPYGSWKVAYEAERRNGNRILIRGILCMAVTLSIFYYSGVMDGLYMPNLDNIMEETEPWNFDQEGRISVLNEKYKPDLKE